MIEVLAMLMIGDGMVVLLDPCWHNRLWKRGPQPYQKIIEELIRRPALTRLLSLLQIGLGIWLVSAQRAR